MKALNYLVVLFLISNVEGTANDTETLAKETFEVVYKVAIHSIKTDELVLGALQYLLSARMKALYQKLTDSVEFKMADQYLAAIGMPFKQRIIEIVKKVGQIPDSAPNPKASLGSFVSDVYKSIPPEKLKEALGASFKTQKTALTCSTIDVQNVLTLIRWVQSLHAYWAIVHEIKKVDLNVHEAVEAVIAAAEKECKRNL